MTELFPPSVTQHQGKRTLFQALPHAPGEHSGENPPILIQRGFGQRLEGAPGSELPWTCSLRLPSTPGEAAQTASSNSAILTAHPNPAPPKLQGHCPWVWWFQLAFVGTCPDLLAELKGGRERWAQISTHSLLLLLLNASLYQSPFPIFMIWLNLSSQSAFPDSSSLH